MTTKKQARVFISSTSIDLKDHRTAVRDMVLSLGMYPDMMEFWSAIDTKAADASLAQVDQADIYIGIFAHRYGFCPDGSDISITEMEFERATSRGIPRFCFLVDEHHPWPPQHVEPDPGQGKLHDLKKRLDATLVRRTFTTPETLAINVATALQTINSRQSASKKPLGRSDKPARPIALPQNRSNSPFVVKRPLRASDKIFGREDIFAFIADQLQNYRCVSIFGEPRMGKTSILNHLYENPSKYLPHQPTNPPLCLINLSLREIDSVNRFYGGIIVRILNNQSRSLRKKSDYWKELQVRLNRKPEVDADEFKQTIQKFRDDTWMGIFPVILIDGFEHLLDERMKDSFPYPEFFNKLSAWIEQELFAIVAFTRKPMAEYFSASHLPRTLTSSLPRYFQSKKLQVLSTEDSMELLLQDSPRRLTLKEAKCALNWAGGNPCLLQTAGQAWYEAKKNKTSISQVKKNFDKLRQDACISSSQIITNSDNRRSQTMGIANVASVLFWKAPISMGKRIQRLGEKFDQIAAWIIAVVIIIVIGLVILKVASGEDIIFFIRKALGLV